MFQVLHEEEPTWKQKNVICIVIFVKKLSSIARLFFLKTMSFIKSDPRVPHFLQLIPPYDHICYLFLPRWPAPGRWRPDPEQRPEDWRELFDRRVGSCQEEPRQRPHVAVRCVFLLVEPAAWFRVTRAPINKLIFPFFACTDESSYVFFICSPVFLSCSVKCNL